MVKEKNANNKNLWGIAMNGFNIFKEGESLKENVNMAGKFRLLIQDKDFEIFESHIHAGRSVICQPYECEDSLNVVFVLSGKLYHLNTKSYIKSGDSYSFKNLEETHYLSVKEDTVLLMIRKKGFFNEQVSKIKKITEFIYRIQEKDHYTLDHCNRTGNIAAKMATYLKLSEKTIENVLFTGKIHDVGKINIPIEILNKPSILNIEEFEIIKEHPQKGHDIIIEAIGDVQVAKIILQHHEKVDGSGYPLGLKNQDISIEAKIIAVADSFDAMTSDRPYRRAMTKNDAIKELRTYAGLWYDKDVVQVLARILEESII